MDLSNVITEVDKCKEASESQFKSAMQKFIEEIKHEIKKRNKQMASLDHTIKYLGDNNDLGLKSNEVVESIKNSWAVLEAMDSRQGIRAARAQQRVTFFANVVTVLDEIKEIIKTIDKRIQKEIAAKKLAEKKQQAAKKAHDKKVEAKENANNMVDELLSGLNSRERFNNLRKSRAQKGHHSEAHTANDNNSHPTLTIHEEKDLRKSPVDPHVISQMRNQIKKSREARASQ